MSRGCPGSNSGSTRVLAFCGCSRWERAGAGGMGKSRGWFFFLRLVNARMGKKNVFCPYHVVIVLAGTRRRNAVCGHMGAGKPRSADRFSPNVLAAIATPVPACIRILLPVRIGTASGTTARERKRRAGIPARRMRVVSRWWRASRRWSTSGASITTFFGLTR